LKCFGPSLHAYAKIRKMSLDGKLSWPRRSVAIHRPPTPIASINGPIDLENHPYRRGAILRPYRVALTTLKVRPPGDHPATAAVLTHIRRNGCLMPYLTLLPCRVGVMTSASPVSRRQNRPAVIGCGGYWMSGGTRIRRKRLGAIGLLGRRKNCWTGRRAVIPWP